LVKKSGLGNTKKRKLVLFCITKSLKISEKLLNKLLISWLFFVKKLLMNKLKMSHFGNVVFKEMPVAGKREI